MKEQEVQEFLNSLETDNSSWINAARKRRESSPWRKKSQMIAVRVLSELHEKGMKQKELAEIIGVTPQQINKIVKGKENLTLETIAKLESALKIDLVTVNVQKTKVKIWSSNVQGYNPTFSSPKLQLRTDVKNQSHTSANQEPIKSYKKSA